MAGNAPALELAAAALAIVGEDAITARHRLHGAMRDRGVLKAIQHWLDAACKMYVRDADDEYLLGALAVVAAWEKQHGPVDPRTWNIQRNDPVLERAIHITTDAVIRAGRAAFIDQN